MKLNQLGLTKAGQTATKKLTRQVHKATVAAAMEPKLRLGVLGIEIGQEQSTGPTSRVNEEVASIDDSIRLLRKLAKTIKYSGLPTSNDPALWSTALVIGRLYDGTDSKAANAAEELLGSMENHILRLATNKVQTDDASTWLHNLKKLGIPSNPLMDFFQRLEDAKQSAKSISKDAQKFSEGLRGILNLFDHITQGLDPGNDTFDALEKKLIKAVCDKLGFKTE